MDNINKNRKLSIYSRLIRGCYIDKEEEAENYGVSLRTIQRDLEDIRDFMAEENSGNKIIYDKKLDMYRASYSEDAIVTTTAIALIKILLGCKAFTKNELKRIIEELCPGYYDWNSEATKEKNDYVKKLIQNELFNYVSPVHGKTILKTISEINDAIINQKILKIHYRRMEGNIVTREIKPVGLLFSEYYFYMPTYFADKDAEDDYADGTLVPVIYRVDRIEEIMDTGRHYKINYATRFQEGEFRKRIQFMQTGTLVKIKFYYNGPSLEAVLDRVPTAKILEHNQRGWLIEAEMYNKGIEMWLRSQGRMVELLEEKEIKNRTY